MDVIYQRCAGLDVHKKSVVACVLVTDPDGVVHEQVRTVGTMTADLATLSTWLRQQGVECVALESTGVYWWPVFTLLEEEGHTVVLVNPQHMKAVPGHKTDVKDSRWLADLLRHGLLRASFIPPAEIRQLRALTRHRKTLVRARNQETNRLHKVLESANIKLAAVATDVLGVSGRHMLAALARGEEDPATLAALAKGRLREKTEALERALESRVQPYHRVLLRVHLEHIVALEQAITTLDEEIGRAVRPFLRQMELLRTIPGVSVIAAATIIAEFGPDMARFVSGAHLASWAGVCPGNRESAGKRTSGKPTGGDVWVRAVLGEVAWAAVRQKGTSFGARYWRIARRQGQQKALVAVMHSLVRVIYHVLHDQVPYHELGPDYYRPVDPQRVQRRLVTRLEELGYTVTLTPKEVA